MGKLGKANTELLDSAMKQKVKEKKKIERELLLLLCNHESLKNKTTFIGFSTLINQENLYTTKA
jgi:hypothetical protein